MELFKVAVILRINMIISVTYMIACHSYRVSGSVVTDEYDRMVDRIMFSTGFLNILVWIVGGIVFQSKATHCCHAVYISILLGVIIPLLTAFGVRVQLLASSKEEIEEVLTKRAMNYWRKHHAVLPLLQELQLMMHCCGLKGPTDYRAFIYNRNKSEGVMPCEDEEFDVPYSCARLEHLYEECREQKLKLACNVYPFTREAIVFENPAITEMLEKMTPREKRKYKCDHARNSSHPGLCDPRNYAIQKDGCLDIILENVHDLRYTNNIMFCLFFTLSFVALMTFLTHWFEDPPEDIVTNSTEPDIDDDEFTSTKSDLRTNEYDDCKPCHSKRNKK